MNPRDVCLINSKTYVPLILLFLITLYFPLNFDVYFTLTASPLSTSANV